MTEYTSTQRYEMAEIGPAGLPDWGISEDSTRAEGTVAVRSLNDLPRVVFIGPPEEAELLFVAVDEPQPPEETDT